MFDARAKCQDFVARFKDDGPLYLFNSPFCTATSTFLVRQSRSPELQEIGRFGPLWKDLVTRFEEIFPEHDTEGTNIVSTIDFRAQVLNVFDRRYGIGVPVFKFAPVGHEQLFSVSSPVCLRLIFLTTFCNKLLVKQAPRPRISRPMCDGRPFASSPFRCLASRGLFSYVAISCCGHYR